MKKSLILLPVSILLLTGCGEKKGTIHCTLTTTDKLNGYTVNADYNIHYKGDYVEYVENTETVTSDNEETLASFESQFNVLYNGMNENYGGYTYSIKKDTGKLTSTVKIDYDKMDLDKLVKDQPTMKNYVKNKKMSKEGIENTYKALGATCE